MTERRVPGTETLARLGLDAAELVAGHATEDRVLALLAGPDGGALADALGDLPSPEVAALLVRLEARAPEKAVRKAIRRALYRLAQRGVPRPAAPPEPEQSRPAAVELEGLVSAVDGRGDRILWLMRPLATGTLLVAAQVNEPAGLRDLQVVDVGRKQLRTTRQRIESAVYGRLKNSSEVVADHILSSAFGDMTIRAGTSREPSWRRP